MISRKPRTRKGMPIGAVITNAVRMPPIIAKARPSRAAINRPVKFRIQVSKFQMATKGQRYQGVFGLGDSTVIFPLFQIRMGLRKSALIRTLLAVSMKEPRWAMKMILIPVRLGLLYRA